MKRRLMNGLTGIALAVMAGCAGDSDDGRGAAPPSSSADSTAGQPWTVALTHYGPVELGASLAAVHESAPGVLEPLSDTDGCQYTGLAGGAEDVIFMVVDGRVVRVDVRDAAVRTSRGAAIGDPEARIRELYPGLEARPHKYTDGTYLIVRAPEAGGFRLVFETDGTRVTQYRAGVLPEVEWVEGCS